MWSSLPAVGVKSANTTDITFAEIPVSIRVGLRPASVNVAYFRGGLSVMGGRKKADPNIGKRAAEEVFRHSTSSIEREMKALGSSASNFYIWDDGICVPSASAFQAMCRRGYDITYILIGKRSKPI